MMFGFGVCMRFSRCLVALFYFWIFLSKAFMTNNTCSLFSYYTYYIFIRVFDFFWGLILIIETETQITFWWCSFGISNIVFFFFLFFFFALRRDHSNVTIMRKQTNWILWLVCFLHLQIEINWNNNI